MCRHGAMMFIRALNIGLSRITQQRGSLLLISYVHLMKLGYKVALSLQFTKSSAFENSGNKSNMMSRNWVIKQDFKGLSYNHNYVDRPDISLISKNNKNYIIINYKSKSITLVYSLKSRVRRRYEGIRYHKLIIPEQVVLIPLASNVEMRRRKGQSTENKVPSL